MVSSGLDDDEKLGQCGDSFELVGWPVSQEQAVAQEEEHVRLL